jgi:hypothetical protein
MACCKCCCGNVDCTEGQQGKCCCGGSSGTCCSESEYCCNGVCESAPCDSNCADVVGSGALCDSVTVNVGGGVLSQCPPAGKTAAEVTIADIASCGFSVPCQSPPSGTGNLFISWVNERDADGMITRSGQVQIGCAGAGSGQEIGSWIASGILRCVSRQASGSTQASACSRNFRASVSLGADGLPVALNFLEWRQRSATRDGVTIVTDEKICSCHTFPDGTIVPCSEVSWDGALECELPAIPSITFGRPDNPLP